MGKFEEDFVYGYPTQHALWKRYIHDIFFIWTGSEDSLLAFLKYLNSCDQNISLTFEKSQRSVHFLDTLVTLANGQLTTDLYSKPTDSHNYLLFPSAHPRKCIESIPYSQYLHIRRICSTLSDYDRHMKSMTIHFLDRGFPIDLLQESALKARRLNALIFYTAPPPSPLLKTTTIAPSW